jgi:Trk K+ transport system NAD-binding subunit
VDLLSLLRSGIPIELPGGQRLVIGVVRSDSPWRDRPLAEVGADDGAVRVFAIIRGEHMMVPRPETPFQAGDRVLVMTTAEGLERLKAHLEKW